MQIQRLEDESLLRLAAISVYENYLEEYASMKEEDIPELTQQQVEEQWRQLRKLSQKNKKKPRKGVKRALGIAAAIALLFNSAFAVALASSPTIREIVLQDFGKYSDVWTIFSNERQTPCPEGWEERYYPSYVPEEYEFYQRTKSSFLSSLVYKSTQKNTLLIFAVVTDGDGLSLDTEGMTPTPIAVGTHSGLLYSGEEKSLILLNYGDCMIFIHGLTSQETILRMAEGIREQ